MANLIRPRIVSLDTAQLSGWARDRASRDADKQRLAERFEQGLAECGVLVMLSWHHVEELLGTESQSAAEVAMDLLAALPAVAWIEAADGEQGISSVVDILGAELAVAVEAPTATASTVRDLVLARHLRTGSGEQAVAKYLPVWRDLQPTLWAQAVRRREIYAITASNFFAPKPMKVRDILKASTHQGEALDRRLSAMQLALQRDISLHGDKRIEDHAGLSQAFFDIVRDAGGSPKSGAELLQLVLDKQGLTLDELDEDATFADISALGHFRVQMVNAADAAGLDPARAKAVAIDRLPSWLVETALRKHRQADLERKGSEPNDAHLAGLASYADVTFVDRRTKETLRQAIQAKSLPRPLLKGVEKNGRYIQALERL
jgi:hypothetical protein